MYNNCKHNFIFFVVEFYISNILYNDKVVEIMPSKIIHAGGEIDGFFLTNSLEAIENSYNKGYKFIEIDFLMSSGEELICVHDWETYYSISGKTDALSLYEFEKRKVFNKFTPLSFRTLVDWLKIHPNVYIITDTKEDNIEILKYISEKYPNIVQNIIPQIYDYEEYDKVNKLGYKNIILTLYKLPNEDKFNTKYNAIFAKTNNLFGVAVDGSIVTEDYMVDFINAGVPVFVHIINDLKEQQRYFDMGVTAVYTDLNDVIIK